MNSSSTEKTLTILLLAATLFITLLFSLTTIYEQKERIYADSFEISTLDTFRLWYERTCGQYSTALPKELWYICRDYPYEYDSFNDYWDATH